MMKTIKSNTAPSLRQHVAGVIHQLVKRSSLPALLALGLASAGLPAAEPVLDLSIPGLVAPASTNATPPMLATNSLVLEIQADLKIQEGKLVAVVQTMTNALNSSPGQYATVVSNTASRLRAFANNLGEGSPILKRADDLTTVMRDMINSVQQAAKSAMDPVDAALYAKARGGLEPQLDWTVEARAKLIRIRVELLQKASALESHALALATVERAVSVVAAAEAFQDMVKEVAKFNDHLSDLIANLGAPPTSPLELSVKSK